MFLELFFNFQQQCKKVTFSLFTSKYNCICNLKYERGKLSLHYKMLLMSNIQQFKPIDGFSSHKHADQLN